MQNKIIWTLTDEAPALATYSLLPIVNAFTKAAGVQVETRDISLAARVLSTFPDFLPKDKQSKDELAYLGQLVKKSEANIIKLPNISASITQLKAAIKELQDKGYTLPNYPEDPQTDKEKALQTRFAKCLGSAVNPVLREGNSDRRVAPSVKSFAQKNPKLLKDWETTSKAHVASMSDGDFFENEKSVVLPKADIVHYEFVDANGNKTLLKEGLKLQEGEVLDATYMSINALRKFIVNEIADAKEKGVLFSVHLKATMMKISDPVMFGQVVSVFFKDVFEKYASTFEELGVNPNLGLGDLYRRIATLDDVKYQEIKAALEKLYETAPDLAMVNSDKGITNLHASNDTIIDASMPVFIRDGGKMWNTEGKLQDAKAIIPDRSYAGIYHAMVEYCKVNGAFDPRIMGNVANVGLMAQKAEEYGSHDKTFFPTTDGVMRVVNTAGEILIEHQVEKGDIYRSCQTKDLPIQDWVKLAVNRARATGVPAIFWLDKQRGHDAVLIPKVEEYLKNQDTTGLEILILPPVEAMNYTLLRVSKGLDTISVTGNVLRDYLTDLFPILELASSSKMLSIVPLLNGGGLFETGAGGSAPKHVQQFVEEGHLRWDSLGEFLALTVSLEHLATTFDNPRAQLFAETLDKAVATYLDTNKAPSRKVGEIDNRGSHMFLAKFWAAALANQDKDAEMKALFAKVAKDLKDKESIILEEIAKEEGKATEIGGYFAFDDALVSKAMRPSQTLNKIIDSI